MIRQVYDRLVPELWRQRLHLARGGTDVFRPCFRETGSIQIHVPKAAGTSVSYALYGGNIGHRTALDYHRISRRHFASYFRFGFVRNPWDRAVSAYQFARSGGTEYVQPIPDPVYRSETFATFERFVMDWLPSASLDEVDVVFRPQWTFLCDRRGDVLVDHIGRTERLTEDLAVVETALGRAIRPEHLNRTARAVDYPSYYTPETRAMVAEIYRRDIEMFGYEFAS
ncbi:MAG: sulfotransferase family 2 domain-containing protein [Actinomycetota bacterium]